MKQKSEFSTLSRAIQTVDGFTFFNETLRQHTALRGQSESYNPCKCSKCKTGTMQAVEILPRIRSPDNVFYPRTETLNM